MPTKKKRVITPREFGMEGAGPLHIEVPYELTAKQKKILGCIFKPSTKCVIINAPSGTGKSFMAVLAALQLYQQQKIENIHFVRSVAESSEKSIGFLKGSYAEKMEVWQLPFEDKLNELLDKQSISFLKVNEIIHVWHVGFLRGLTFHNSVVTVDEAQNSSKKELVTIMTRLGNNSKLIMIGDSSQNDINGKSGFAEIIRAFDDEESRENGVHFFELGKEDILRSGFVRFVADKLSL